MVVAAVVAVAHVLVLVLVLVFSVTTEEGLEGGRRLATDRCREGGHAQILGRGPFRFVMFACFKLSYEM